MNLDLGRASARGYDRDRASTDRSIQRMGERLRQVPAAWAEQEAAAEYRVITIGGGNAAEIGNSLEGIQYVAGPLILTAAYDPNVDTVMDAGLGWGWLTVDGEDLVSKILIRHDFFPCNAPLLAARPVRPTGLVTLEYDPGGGGDIVYMQAYRVSTI